MSEEHGGGKEHGDRKGRYYYTTKGLRSPYIVVAGLAPAMRCWAISGQQNIRKPISANGDFDK